MPKGEYGVSDTVWNKLARLNTANNSFEVVDITGKTKLNPNKVTPEDLRQRAGGIARHNMHKLEIEMIDQTDGLRNDGTWLIIDGAVKLNEFIKKDFMIGVAKSFDKSPIFRFGKSKANKDITAILAGLPYAHRTAVFSSDDGDVAFWYVRLREQKQVDYPLMGVIKVEYPRRDKTPMTKELADLLSQTLVAERNATPHGRDNRWHCHLYPIFLAEQAIKNSFQSKQVLMGMVRWAPFVQPA